jgi:hypothetical protein
MVFQFPIEREARTELRPQVPEAEPEPETIGLINGMVPDSKEEYWIALALWRLKLDFFYQFIVLGGRSVRGGLVLDFLVNVPPVWVPVMFNGEWWHRNESKQRWDEAILQQEFGVAPVVIWGDEVPDKETTYQVVKAKLRV